MKLDVTQRLLIMAALPDESDLSTIRMVRKLKERLGFTAKESVDWEIKQNEKGYAWNPEKAKAVEKTISAEEHILIGKSLKALSNKNLLTENHLSLWDLFVTEGGA